MAACVSRVELSVPCRSLLDRDLGSRSDSLCVLLQDAGDGEWAELDRTEKVKNRQDPEFYKKLVVDYNFEKVQLKFSMYDTHNKSFDLNDADYLGGIECTLGQGSKEEGMPTTRFCLRSDSTGQPTSLLL